MILLSKIIVIRTFIFDLDWLIFVLNATKIIPLPNWSQLNFYFTINKILMNNIEIIIYGIVVWKDFTQYIYISMVAQ